MKSLWMRAALLAAVAACAAPRVNLFTDPNAGEALRAEIAANPGGPVAAVHRVWVQYMDSKGGRLFDCTPSPYWLASEQKTWTAPDGRSASLCYDLAGANIDQSHTYKVLAIEPVRDSRGTEYRITTRFRNLESHTPGQPPRAALITVFAVRDGSEWKLAGAMGRTTSSWRRETVGPFTYVIPPGFDFSRSRAQQAVIFADSLSTAFGVPRISPVHYYLVRDGDAMMRLVGYQSDTTFGTPGGRTMPGFIISGDSVFREKHGHEIAHQVLQSLYGPRLSVAASEGLPTWVGGTRTMHYPVALQALRKFLSENPSATLDTVLANNAHTMHNPGAALLAAMVYEHGGVNAIRQFCDSGPSLNEFKTGVAMILGKPWDEIAKDWKRRALEQAKRI